MTYTGKDSRSARRYKAIRHWVQARLGEVRHERRVAALALSLVRTTGPLHFMSGWQRRLLKMSAMVHDVGRAKDAKRHPVIGARMLLRNESLPLSPFERRALAYLTRYHRGAVPPPGHDDILKKEDPHEEVLQVLAFLRLADALDSRSLPAPRLGIHLRGRRLVIDCAVLDDSPKARRVFGRRKKLRLLEEVLDCRVDVTLSVHSPARFRAVA
jgi:exopolyphosphatase/guanosine-5'-triphosphate,3'-diphosphate pyrophosphatase